MTRKIFFGFGLLIGALATIGLIYFNQGAAPQIIVSDRMSEFIDSVDRSNVSPSEMVIVFDIDDTTIMSSQLVGTPNWFYNIVNMIRQNGASRNEAYQVASEIDRIVQKNIGVKAVENSTIRAIKTWQDEGATVIALSSRPQNIASTTQEQLQSVGLDFSSPKLKCVENRWKPKKGGFQNGIIYSGNFFTKREVFSQFYLNLIRCGVKISLIAHADDQEHYISEMSRLAQENRVDFIGIIYGGAISSRNFDIAKANMQLIDLEKRLGVKLMPEQYRDIIMF